MLRTETSPSQIRRWSRAAADLHRLARPRLSPDTPDATHSPVFHQVEGLAVDEGITLADLTGTLDFLLQAALRRGAADRFRTHSSRSPSPRSRPTSPAASATAPAARSAGARGGSRSAAPASSTRSSSSSSATTQSGTPASRSARASSASRCCATSFPTSASYGGTTSASRGSSDARPALLAARICQIDATPAEIARRPRHLALEVDRVIDAGVGDLDDNLSFLRVGASSPPTSTPTPTGSSSARSTSGALPHQIVCGAWNFGVGATVAVGLPGVLLPGFPAPLEERPLRGEVSRGMILAEDEIGLGTITRGSCSCPTGSSRARPSQMSCRCRPGAGRDADDEPARPALDGRAGARGRRALRRRAAPGDVVDPPVTGPEGVDVAVEASGAARGTSGACSAT